MAAELIFTDPIIEETVRISHTTLYILEALGAALVVVIGRLYLRYKGGGVREGTSGK